MHQPIGTTQAEHKEEHNDAKLKKKKELMGFHVGSVEGRMGI